jgi:ABC-type transport system involved in multi-copper enzyme maturation permease subunit
MARIRGWGEHALKKAWFIALKEWTEILRDFYVLGILVFLPLAMVGTLVVLIYFYMTFFLQNLDKIQLMLSSMPKAYLEGLSEYTDIQKVAILPIKIIGLPFFLLIPLLMSGIVTADSFAGERERNTLEALLTTPIRDWELLLGKILTPFAPALLVTWASFLLLTRGISSLINPHFLSPVFPDTIWILSVALVVPLFLIGTVLAEILISARAASVKTASALNMLLSFPVLGVMLVQSTGFVLFSARTLPWMIASLAALDALLFIAGLRSLRRRGLFQ